MVYLVIDIFISLKYFWHIPLRKRELAIVSIMLVLRRHIFLL